MHNKNILISPYSKKIEGKLSPKDWGKENWEALVKKIREHSDYNLIQVGVEGEEKIKGVDLCIFNIPFDKLKRIVQNSRVIISVDNFMPHFCKTVNKSCYVIWGPSDSSIFGYPENKNILGNTELMRKQQFWLWCQCEKVSSDAFPSVEDVFKYIKNFI